MAQFVHRMAITGKAMRIGMCAQTDDETRNVMVDGDSGLRAVAPPWERPEMVRGILMWPGGAQGFLHAGESPAAMRGPGFHLSWASEMIAWRRNRTEEAWSNLRIMTSLGTGRMVGDTTPRRRNQIVRAILERSERAPERHVVVRGRIADNLSNLDPEAVAELVDDYGGTSRGREELDGEFLDDNEAVLFQQEWINAGRREMPARLERRVLSVDPAISMRRGTDATGIADGGLGLDGQVYCIADLTGRMAWEVWGEVVVERYFQHCCDCVVVERNRGGDAVAANLRARARELLVDGERGVVTVVLVDAKAPTRHDPRVIYVKEVWARGTKDVRAEPVSPLYESGRVSHVRGADLEELEEQLTTWEPGEPSPNAMDAWIHCVWELAGLAFDKADPRRAFEGLDKVRAAMQGQRRPAPRVGSLLRRDRSRSRI